MQQLNPSEISEIIKQRIEKLNVSVEVRNEGTVVSVTDGIIRIHGLADVMYGEMIEFEGGIYGMALNLEQDSVGAVVLAFLVGLMALLGDLIAANRRLNEQVLVQVRELTATVTALTDGPRLPGLARTAAAPWSDASSPPISPPIVAAPAPGDRA